MKLSTNFAGERCGIKQQLQIPDVRYSPALGEGLSSPVDID